MMEEFAKKLLHDHRNPVVKVDSPGIKSYLKSTPLEENNVIQKHQNNLEHILRHARVDRRCARAQAEWCPDIKLAKVTKVIKGLVHSYGYQDRTGIFLYPEEVLFLVETNRLELMVDGISLSIKECYDLVITQENCRLRTYRVYKKLVQQGYKLIRYAEILRRNSQRIILPHESKKRKIQLEDSRDQTKTDSKSEKSVDHKIELINKINDNLMKNAPKEFISNSSEVVTYDYAVFLPTNKSKTDCDFILIICKSDILSEIIPNDSTPTIYAVCTDDNISFHRLGQVHLPIFNMYDIH